MIDASLPLPPYRIYRRYFSPAECAGLDGLPPDSAASELAVLRIALTRLLRAARRASHLSLDSHFAFLSAACAAALTIGSLVRFELRYNPAADPFSFVQDLPFEVD